MSSTETNSGYLACRLIGLLGTGFASGAFLSTAYFTIPGLLRSKEGKAQALAFREISNRSQALFNRIVFPSAFSLIYAAVHAPSHATDWINPASLLGIAATTVTFTLPYSYFKMSRADKALNAAGEAVQVEEEQEMGVKVVDDGIVSRDLTVWMQGGAVQGWLTFVGFVIAASVEVYYL